MANREILLRYGALKIQDKQTKAEIEMIKDQALQEVLQLRGDTDSPIALEDLPGCTFSVKKLKTWEYSPEVTDLKKRLEDRQTLEQQNGDATFTEKDSLTFNTPKE